MITSNCNKLHLRSPHTSPSMPPSSVAHDSFSRKHLHKKHQRIFPFPNHWCNYEVYETVAVVVQLKMDEKSVYLFLSDLSKSLHLKKKSEGEALMSQGIPKNRLTIFRYYHHLEVLEDGVDTILGHLGQIKIQRNAPPPTAALKSFSEIVKSTAGAVEQILAQLVKTSKLNAMLPLPDHFNKKEDLVKKAIMEAFTSITKKATDILDDNLNLTNPSA